MPGASSQGGMGPGGVWTFLTADKYGIKVSNKCREGKTRTQRKDTGWVVGTEPSKDQGDRTAHKAPAMGGGAGMELQRAQGWGSWLPLVADLHLCLWAQCTPSLGQCTLAPTWPLRFPRMPPRYFRPELQTLLPESGGSSIRAGRLCDPVDMEGGSGRPPRSGTQENTASTWSPHHAVRKAGVDEPAGPAAIHQLLSQRRHRAGQVLLLGVAMSQDTLDPGQWRQAVDLERPRALQSAGLDLSLPATGQTLDIVLGSAPGPTSQKGD